MYRLVLAESDRHPEVGSAFFESAPRPVVDALAEYLTQATARRELQVENPALASSQFMFMIKGFSIDLQLLGLPEDALDYSKDEYVEHCCASFLRAFTPSTAGSL